MLHWSSLNWLACACLLLGLSEAYLNPLDRVSNDFLALTRRVTARHILLPPNSNDAALVLKRKIRDKCVEQKRYVVDVFEEAATKYSRDETTNQQGGLLGELVPQGFCKSNILDRACFQVALGQLEGPIETEYGCHLLLVTERTNCQKLDGRNTKLVQTKKSDLFGTLIPAEQVGRVSSEFVLGQVTYWLAVIVAGCVLAETIAQATS